MGSSLPESRRGATLYSASWPRGRPPERSAQRCGGRLPPSDPVEPRATSRRVLSPPPPPSSPSPPPPSPSPPPPSLSPRPPQQLGGLSYRGFPARHPGGVARPAAAAARPHPRSRAATATPTAPSGQCRGSALRARKESEELLFNAHTSPAMCEELTGGPPVRWFVI